MRLIHRGVVIPLLLNEVLAQIRAGPLPPEVQNTLPGDEETILDASIWSAWDSICPACATDDEPEHWRVVKSHILQFSPGRAKKRLLGSPVVQVNVQRAPSAWHFGKISKLEEELLVELTEEELFHGAGGARKQLLLSTTESGLMNGTGIGNRLSTLRVLRNLHPVSKAHVVVVPPGTRQQLLDWRGLATVGRLSLRSSLLRLYYLRSAESKYLYVYVFS